MEQILRSFNVDEIDLQKIEDYFEKKGLVLIDISKHINWVAIANVELINPPEDVYDQSEFNVIIDIQKKLCRKFDFFNNRTDGLRIYPNKSSKKVLEITEPRFKMSFIKTLGGSDTPYILVQYCELNRRFRDENCSFVYIEIINIFNDYSIGASFKLCDMTNFDRPIEVYLLEDDITLFAYRFNYIVDDLDMNMGDKYSFDGIINGSCKGTTFKKLTYGENVFDVAEKFREEIIEEEEKNNDDYDDYDIYEDD